MAEVTLCNAAWPCGETARWALKVFETIPRYACYLHEREMRVKGAELRRLSEFPGPWIEPVVAVDGTGKVVRTSS